MNKRNTAVIFSLLTLMFSSMISCTKVDDSLGNDFIPDDQRMKIAIDTIFGIDAYLARQDSFPTSNLTEGAYVGSQVSKQFGRLKATAAFQYMWDAYSFEDLDAKFGTKPVADSLMLVLSVSGYGGDTLKTQTFNIYRLEKQIYHDSAYYANFDAEAIAEKEPLFTFDYSGTRKINLKMTGAKVNSLMNELMDTTTGAYRSDSMFYKQFKGFYIAPAAGSPQDASVMTFNMKNSYMELHVRNFAENGTTPKDTLSVKYYFEISDVAPNASVNTFQYDYSGTGITGINDTLPTSAPISVGYMQGFGGLSTYLRFQKEFIADLKSKIVPPYKTMVINNARIEFDLADPTEENLKLMTGRVGMYKNLVKTFSPIVDYNYTYEDTYNTTLPYGGYLNRTHNNYTMNVSAFIQNMVQSDDPNERCILMAPARNYLYGFSEAAVKTPFDPNDPKRMRVIVTYTLIR